MIILPMAPSAMYFLATCHCKAEVVCEPTCSTRLVSFTVWERCRASSMVWHMGFSRYTRSEEHTSELQSLRHLVCRLLLEKKKAVRWMPVYLWEQGITETPSLSSSNN